MKLNFDDPTTRWALAVGTIAVMPKTAEPVAWNLRGLAELEGMPVGNEPVGSAYLHQGRMNVAWAPGNDDRGAILLAARVHAADAIREAELARHAPHHVVWTVDPWGAQSDCVRAWVEVSRLLRASPGTSIPERIELDDGSKAALLVRGPRVLILGVNSNPAHSAREELPRALIAELDSLLGLSSIAGATATHQVHRLAVVRARQAGLTPSQYLLQEIDDGAAWALVVAERCGDLLVREALGLDQDVLPRLRLHLAPGRNETLLRRYEHFLSGLADD